MNLISCHGFGKDKNSTVVLLCRTWSVGYQLEKWFIIIEHNSKNLSNLPNEVKQIIYAIDIRDSDYVITCYKQITSVSNTINKLRIMSDLHYAKYITSIMINKILWIVFFFNTLKPD